MSKKKKKSIKKFSKEMENLEKKARKQRKKQGYADIDVWNLNSWFMKTLKPMLQQLKDTHQGFPGYLDFEWYNSHQKELDMTYDEWVSWPSKEKDPKGYKIRSTANAECSAEWDAILEEMIFLLGEMDEETCQKKNPYEKEVHKAYDEFHEKYGFYGDGLKTKDEKKKEKKQKAKRMLFPDDEPGREDIQKLFKKYRDEEEKLAKYREKCKNKFFKLFAKHFYSLWD